MRYLDAQATRDALSMSDAVEAMEWAFTGVWEMPPRTSLGPSLVMQGLLDGVMAVKVVSVVPGNPAGVVVVFDFDGSPAGMVDGHALTAIRTGAVTGLATRLLSSPNASTLAMLGAGAMAPDMIEAVKAVRPIERVIIWSRDHERAVRLAERLGGEAAATADEAVAVADVVSCATPSRNPLFQASSVREGTHVNAVGSFRPDMVELPAELVDRAYVVVDDTSAAATEAGDLIQAGREPTTTLREMTAGTNPLVGEDVTVFKSVGIALQDVAAAHRALANATDRDLGLVL
jgi:ornithine cyclodeaminase